jgi:hypothetical protein
MHAVVSKQVKEFYTEDAQAFDPRYPAVKFRGKVYVATPRHLDAINLAFAGMTQMQKHRVSNRIADGKETMLFGSAKGDGTGWEWNEKFQATRIIMYGFD